MLASRCNLQMLTANANASAKQMLAANASAKQMQAANGKCNLQMLAANASAKQMQAANGYANACCKCLL
ncbi:hypothetical protein Tco_0244398 [Tanacetum coccineum]